MDESHTPDELLTRFTFWKVIKSYIPNEFLETVDDAKFSNRELIQKNQKEIVKYVIDNSNHKMRMYGSAKELTEELNKFRYFPMCHKFFEFERFESYNFQMRRYSDNNGADYHSKDSVFTYVHSLIHLNLQFSMHPHISLILTLFLKIREEKLKNCLEFIPFDDEFINYMNSELETLFDVLKIEVPASYNHPKYSLNDYIDLFTKLLPHSCTAKEIASLRKYVIEFHNLPRDGSWEETDPLFVSYIEVKNSLVFIKRLTEKTPHLFSRWIDLPPGMSFKVMAIARLFKYRSGDIFIEAELEEAFKIYQTGHAQPSKTIEGNFLYTIDADAAEKKYGMDLRKVTIIQDETPLKFPELTPIPTNFGVFVISGLHAFYRLFRRITFVHKVFQKMTNNNMDHFNRYLDIIDEELDLRGTRKYMLKYDVLHRLEKMTADYWNEVLPQPAKDVRNAKSDGFTVQNLKNELVHLGLTNAFPNIADYAEWAYKTVLMNKREKYLRTCDLFTAIMNCQFSCVLARYPIVTHFFKTQGGQFPNIPPEMLPMEISSSDNNNTTLMNTTKSSMETVKENTKFDNLSSEISILKTQLESAQTEIDTFREQKLDEKLSKCREQIEVLERERSAHSNCSEKIEKLNAKIKKGEEREKKLEETNKALENFKDQMKKKMDKLEAEKSRAINAKDRLNERLTDLEASNKQHKEKEKQRTKLIQKLESDVKKEKEKNGQIQKLQDENAELKIQKQEMERMIQELTAPGTSSSEVSKENQSKIEEYRRWKKYSCEQLRKARKMADKLATTTSNEVTRRMAIYEISQFEFHVRNYVETIDTNIQKMETFNSFAEISIPTNYPSFSQKFLEEYWKLPKEGTRNGLEADMECLICHDDMRKGEENLLKCHECLRFYHIQCAVRWIQEKHCCAVCKFTLVDPNELPYYE